MTRRDAIGRPRPRAGSSPTTSASGRASGSRSSSTPRTDDEIRAMPSPRAARDLGAEPVVVDDRRARARSGAEPPAAGRCRDGSPPTSSLCAASTSLYHTTAKAAAQRAGARGDFNAPYRADAWRNGAMTADFFAIREQAERLAALWRRTSEVRVTSPAGTDLRATVAGREPMAWLTGICRNPGEVSALPGGEVSLPPLEGTAEGVVVWERVASDLGALEEPVRIEVRGGRAVGIAGGGLGRPPARHRRDRPRRRQHRRDRHRAQPGGPHRRRDHRGQEGARHGPCRARRFGQRVRRHGRVRRPPRWPGHGADDRVRRAAGRRRRPPRATTSRDRPIPVRRPRAIIERMRAVEGAGPRTAAGDPLVVDHASGSTLVDPDGNASPTWPAASPRRRSATAIPTSSRLSRRRSARELMCRPRPSASSASGSRRTWSAHRAARPRPRAARHQRRRRQRHRPQARAHHDRPARGPGLLGRVLRPCRRASSG